MAEAEKITRFDPAAYVETDQDAIAYLEAAMESGNADRIARALGVVARARGMTEIARQTGMSRESLYKALSERGDPKLSSLMKVLRALGVRLTIAAKA